MHPKGEVGLGSGPGQYIDGRIMQRVAGQADFKWGMHACVWTGRCYTQNCDTYLREMRHPKLRQTCVVLRMLD